MSLKLSECTFRGQTLNKVKAKLTLGVLDSFIILELGKLLNVQSLKGLPFIGQISS